MSKGLKAMAQSVLDLVASSSSCGKLKTFERLKDQADRLRVVAGASMGFMDSGQLKYEPLKELVVGDVDIHLEINKLIIAWQLNKGPQETGTALVEFFGKFGDTSKEEVPEEPEEPDDEPEPAEPETPTDETTAAPNAEEEHIPPPIAGDTHDKKTVRTVAYWGEVLSAAFSKLGDTPNLVTYKLSCITTGDAESMGNGIELAFNTMMEKNRLSMQKGLKMIALEVTSILDRLEANCDHFKSSIGPQKLRNAAARMAILSGSKADVDYSEHVEYEPMKTLKLGGIDVHAELNTFIVAWVTSKSATEMGEGMAEFFKDFQEKDVVEESQPSSDAGKSEESPAVVEAPMVRMLLDGFKAAGDELPSTCLTAGDQKIIDFDEGIQRAVDHMLLKKSDSMHDGLEELAASTDKLLTELPTECTSGDGAKKIRRAARIVKKLTRKTEVDYGTHIEYEALKSLTVGKVAIHKELNNFIAAWKLRSRAESGGPFGELFVKLSTIEGHDEL
jgi:hypothetical protein